MRGGKLILFGNGGSATDANDWALDCVAPPAGYRPVPAISLALEPATLTAIANDVGTDVDLPAPAHRPGAAGRRRGRDLDQRRLAQRDRGAGRGAQARPADGRAARLRRRRDRAPRPGRHHDRGRLATTSRGSRKCRRRSTTSCARRLEELGHEATLSCTARPPARTRATCASGSSGAAPTSSSTTSRPTARRASGCARVAGGQRTVPVLVEDGAVVQVGLAGPGLHGRSSSAAGDERLLDPRPRRGAGRRLPAVRLPAGARATRWPAGCSTAARASRSTSKATDERAGRVPARPREQAPAGREHHRHRRRRAPRRSGLRRVRDPRQRGGASRPRPASRRTCRSCADCLRELFDPADRALPLSVHQLHRTAARATRSCSACRTTAPRRRWTPGRCDGAARARVSRSRETGGSTPSRSPARLRPALSSCAIGGRRASSGRRCRSSAAPPRCFAPGASSRSRASAAITWRATPATPTRSLRCASGSSARRSRSR